MSHRSFSDPHSIEARQALLDNRAERSHPKRHRTRRKSAARAAQERLRRQHVQGTIAKRVRAFKAAARAYWAGESPEHP